MRSDKSKITNIQKANLNKKNFNAWKQFALTEFGYYPIFKPFKEKHLLRNLSGNAVKLYIYLGLRSNNTTGETWVSIETMAKYFDKSERTIGGWLKELRKANLIERFQLETNGVAHTFLLPYGDYWFDGSNLEEDKPNQLEFFEISNEEKDGD